MQTKGKRLVLLSGSLFLALGAITVATISVNSASDSYGLDANGDNYEVLFNGSNGNATTETKKTTIAAGAKTTHGNDVSVEYKSMTPVSGKIGKLNAPVNGFKAYYGNATPINGISSITVSSDAQAGDAFLIYGKTSACLDGQVDLATGSVANIYAHYFKIVANSEVTINSVGIALACDNADNGLNVMYNTTSYNYQFTYVDYNNGTYTLKRTTSGALTSAVIPDFYDGNDGFGYITYLMGKSTSWGMFEGADANLESVVMPETVTGFGDYFFTSSSYNKLTELTIPRELTTIGGTSCNTIPVSSSLKTVHYHARNLSYSNTSGRFDKAKQTALETITVSADVESLPNDLVNSFRDDVTIYYDGTEAEWASLVATAPKWNTAKTIICSDTTLATITFSFTNATLGENEDSLSIDAIVGREVANPGSPVSKDGTKKFDGWYTEPDGAGSKVTFPYVASSDAVLYANFVDIPAGYSIDTPIDAVLGESYAFATDAVNSFGYVRYTATSPVVVIAYATNWSSSGTCNFSVYDSDDTSATVSITTGNGGDTDVKAGPTAPTGSGANVPVKIRMEAGDSYIFKFGSAGNDASFDVVVREVDSGEDYTTAFPVTEADTFFNVQAPKYGVRWLTFEIEEAGDYCFVAKSSTSTWAGVSIGTISGTTYTNKSSALNNPGTDGTTSVVHLDEGTYYVPVTSNGAQEVSFRICSTIPEGYAKSTAETIEVGGDSITVSGVKQVAPMWYTFTADTDGRYIITSNNNLAKATASPTWWGSTHYVGVYAEDDTMQTLTNVKSGDNKKFYADLTAGTYYIKAAAYAYGSTDYSYTLAVSKANAVSLTFNTVGGSAIAPAAGYAGFSFTKPADPTKTGYRFDGWYADASYSGDAISFPYTIEENTEIFAKWVKQVTVTLHGNNEQADVEDIVDEGTKYSPADPTYAKHSFLGWYTDATFDTPFVSGTAVTSDTELFAKWESANYDGSGANYIDKEVSGSSEYLEAPQAGITKPSEVIGKYSSSVYTDVRDFVAFKNDEVCGNGIKSSNEGVSNSGSAIELHFKKASLFSFKYFVQSEANYDLFKIYVAGELNETVSGNASEPVSKTVRVEAGQSVLFTYSKDNGGNGSGFDAVKIFDLKFNPAPVILTGLTLDTESVTKEYAKNGTFSAAGLVATANYSDGSTAVLDSSAYTISEPDMSKDAYVTVTVYYSETISEVTYNVSATFEIKVGDPSRYTNTAASYIDKLPNSSSCLRPYSETASESGIAWETYSFVYYENGSEIGIKSNNKGANSTSAIIYLRFQNACKFSFSYRISSESGYDQAYVKQNDNFVVGNVSGTKTDSVELDVKAGDVLMFVYGKDGSSASNDDTFYIYNIKFTLAN